MNSLVQRHDGDSLEALTSVCFTVASRCAGLEGATFKEFLCSFLSELSLEPLNPVTCSCENDEIRKFLFERDLKIPFLSCANNPFNLDDLKHIGNFCNEWRPAGNNKQVDITIGITQDQVGPICVELIKNYKSSIDGTTGAKVMQRVASHASVKVGLLVTNKSSLADQGIEVADAEGKKCYVSIQHYMAQGVAFVNINVSAVTNNDVKLVPLLDNLKPKDFKLKKVVLVIAREDIGLGRLF